MNALRRLSRIFGCLARPVTHPRLLAGLTRADIVVLTACIAVYGATRLVRLADYPAYFFCDEAANANMAENLLRHHFTAWDGVFPDGTLLPPYFDNDERVYPSITVYIHALSILLFGKSLFVVRATSAAVSALAALAIALALKLVFKVRSWWTAPLLLTVTPIWFLHSRTAFESTMMVSFYACFVCTYLLYRGVSPAWAPLTVLAGAGTFYAHPNGQGIMLVTGILLSVLDARYHLRAFRRHRRAALASAGLLVLAAVPYTRLLLARPNTTNQELRRLNSYVLRDTPLREKLGEFSRNYATALSATYWFAPHYEHFVESPAKPSWVSRLHFTPPSLAVFETVRHTMRGYGNLPLLAGPFLLAGLLATVWKARSSGIHRAILVAVVAAPFTSALVALHQQRVMALIVPATLLACLGLEALFTALAPFLPRALVGAAVAALLLAQSYRLTADAVQNGPLWTANYGLYGLEYGAQQVFAAVNQELAQIPGRRCFVSGSWANNPGEFIPFFVPLPQRGEVDLFDLDEVLAKKTKLDPSALYVLPQKELDLAVESCEFAFDPLRVLRYPDGRPGFYFVRLRYVEGIEQILATRRLVNAEPLETSATIDGWNAEVWHSPLEFGEVSDVFDGKLDTLVRAASNLLMVDVRFERPRLVRRIALDGWLSNLTVSLAVYQTGDTAPLVSTRTYPEGEEPVQFELHLPGVTRPATRIRIELCSPGEDLLTHIQLSEVGFR
jgi:4-amino-4-deoxy-L-arabinose transferase-like glycosyltransferase